MYVDAKQQGTDMWSGTAAAFAMASLAFKESNATLAAGYLDRARSLYR